MDDPHVAVMVAMGEIGPGTFVILLGITGVVFRESPILRHGSRRIPHMEYVMHVRQPVLFACPETGVVPVAWAAIEILADVVAGGRAGACIARIIWVETNVAPMRALVFRRWRRAV